MFTRLCMISFCLVLTVSQCFAGSQNGLRDAVDEFLYSMEVEGAALDPALKLEAAKKLNVALLSLQESGMSNEELINLTISQIKNQSVANDMKEVLNTINAQNLSALDARDMVKDALSHTSSQGANWTGNSVMPFLAIGVMVLIVALVMSGDSTSSDGSSDTSENIDARADMSIDSISRMTF